MNPGEAETEKLEASVDKSKMKGGRADQDKSLCYACNICGKSFPFQSSLSQHMRKHTGERPYKCPYCEHRASQKGSLKLHIRGHKLGTLSHGFEEADGELAEAGVSEGLGACASPTESTSACNGVLHDGAKDDDGDKVPSKGAKRDRAALRCALCKRKLGSREELERHAQLHKPYRCRLCSFVVMREDQLLCHIEKMHITVEAAVPEAVDGEAGPDGQSEGPFPCKLCDKVFGQAWLLKAHTKKHLASTEHCCHVCGRRFREAWFLRSHMKTHGSKAGGRGKAKGDSEPAATINDVVQDETAMVNGLCLFEICSRCGNLFHDQESLQVHERVHTHAHRINGKRPHSRRKSSGDLDSSSAKKLFMEGLNLRPAAAKDSPMEETLGKRIPELDPVCSYQAWQLTTKGRVAEVSDAGRYLGWDEVLEDADVAYDEEKGEYTVVGPERCRQEPGCHSTSGGQRRRSNGNNARHQHRSSGGSSCQPSPSCVGEVSPESMSDAEYRPPSRQSRRASQSKSAECFECGRVFRTHHQMVLHSRMHRKDARSGGESRGQGERLGSASEAESGSASRPSTPGCEDSPPFVVGEDTAGDASLDKKPYICNRCNVVTTDLSSWLSHVKLYHKEQGGEPSSSRPNQIEPKSTEGEGAGSLPAGAGEGTEFPKLKKALLQEPPVPSSPRGGAAGSAAEMQNGTRTRGKVDSVPLNLTLQAGSQTAGVGSRLQGSMVTHQCTSCPFVTRYPEVLWIHQRVYHKANGGTPAARWTPKRRTGPPPALDGQECPPLPPTWVPRTRPPVPGSSRKSRSVESSSSSSNRDSSSVSRAPPSKSPLHPAKKHKASKHSAEEGMQSRPRLEPHPTADSAAAPEKSAAGCPRRTGSPKGSSQLERFSLPREGLGFMLSSKHALSENARGATLSSHPLPGRTHNQQETHGPRHGADPRAAPGSGAAWSRSSALLDAPPFLTQVTKEPSTDIAEPPGGIFGFLKSCNSHGLTNLYQRWGGLTGSALDHTGILRSLVRQGDYPCQECGKSFGQPSHLRTHMRSHTGERPFRCQHCPYSSSQKGNLKTHVQCVHRLAFEGGLQQGRPRPPGQPAEHALEDPIQDRSVPETTVLD